MYGAVTSQNLWSRYDRHFVGKTWHNVRNRGAKIYRVILVQENVYVVINLPTKRVFKQYHSNEDFSAFYP